MPGLRESLEHILMSYLDDKIDDDEFCFLYDENQSLDPYQTSINMSEIIANTQSFLYNIPRFSQFF